MHQDQSKRQTNGDWAVTADTAGQRRRTGDSLSFSIAPRGKGRVSKYTRIFPPLSREVAPSAAIAPWWQQQLAQAAERLLGSPPETVPVRRLSVEEGLIYRSAIAFPLAKRLSRSPLGVACQLLGELPSDLPGPATASVDESGWIDWGFGEGAVARWLTERLAASDSILDEIAPVTPLQKNPATDALGVESLKFPSQKRADTRSEKECYRSRTAPSPEPLIGRANPGALPTSTSELRIPNSHESPFQRRTVTPAAIGDDSFFVQYTYDRAQMLLRLGTERGLVHWEDDRWQGPLPVPWQLEGSALWGAIAALVDLCDRGEAPPGPEWLGPAAVLSEALWGLHREVPLFGDVSCQQPAAVQSRLGIWAIARLVLGWTLSTRLGIVLAK